MEVVKNTPDPIPTPPPTYTLTLSERETRTLLTLVGKTCVGVEGKVIKDGQDYEDDFIFVIYENLIRAGVQSFDTHPYVSIKAVSTLGA